VDRGYKYIAKKGRLPLVCVDRKSIATLPGKCRLSGGIGVDRYRNIGIWQGGYVPLNRVPMIMGGDPGGNLKTNHFNIVQ